MKNWYHRFGCLAVVFLLLFGMLPLSLGESVSATAFLENSITDPEEYAIQKQAYYDQYVRKDSGALLQSRSATVVSNRLLSNEYIEFAMENTNGRFTVGTTAGNPSLSTDNNKLLLFGHSNPWSSYTTVNVNGTSSIYGDSGFSVAPYFEGNSNISIARFGDIQVEQIISIVNNASTNREDVVEIKYIVLNTGSKSTMFGLRIMLDTMLGDNDAAPFRIPGVGNLTTEREFTGDDIPVYWQAFDSLTSPKVVSYGNFLSGAIKPSKVQFTNWGNVYDTSWNYRVNTGEDNGDSAVSVIWERLLTAGQEETYVTRYGLSELVQDLRPPLGVTIAGDGAVPIDKANNRYLPYTITAYIQNLGSVTASDVICTITLPDELAFSGTGETGVVNLGNMSVGQEKTVEKRVIVKNPPSSKREVTFSITVTASNAESKTVSKSITIEPIAVKKAIIVVPGICGSRLYANENLNTRDYLADIADQFMPSFPEYYQFSSGRMLWEPYTSTVSNKLSSITTNQNLIQSEVLSLMCNEDGTSLNEIKTDNPASNKYGAQDTYKTLVTGLYSRYHKDYDVSFFSYDWRMNNTIAAENLENYINEKGYTKVILVCHSMGGLVASEYLRRSEENQKKVDKLITLGTPYLGAPKALYIFETGNFLSWAENTFCMATPIKLLANNVLGIYELLPTKEYIDFYGYYLIKHVDNGWFERSIDYLYNSLEVTNELISSREWAKKTNGTAKPMLSQAVLFQSGIAPSYINNHIINSVDSYVVIGYGKDTIMGVKLKYNKKGEFQGVEDLKVELSGDGTVPTTSAYIGGFYPYGKTYYIQEEHSGLASNSDVIELVQHIIDEEPSNYNHSTISKTLPEKVGKKTIKLRLSCPVTLSILDKEGNIYAFASENLLYNEDEDKVSLYVLGENNGTKMAYLHQMKNEILMQGTDNGVMTYTVSLIEDDLETKRVIFLNVPITEKTLIYTNTDLDKGLKLNVDENGDGKVDYILQPDKILTGSDLETIMENHYHTCDQPVFVWAKDFSTCQAVFTCDLGDAQETMDCTVTCEQKDRKKIFTAHVDFMDRVFTDVQTIDDDGNQDIPLTGDTTPLTLYIILLILSALGIVLLVYYQFHLKRK